MSTPSGSLRLAAVLCALAPFAVAAQTAAPQQAAEAQAAAASYVGGEVMFVSGQAKRQKADGANEAVAKGMTLLEGDRIKTAADSHVYVRLRDGGLLVVRPASELHVDLWRYDPARPQDSMIKYTLDGGVARHVSGQGAKAARDKFRFNTPMAAIGVRGTDFTVLAEPGLTRISVQSGGVIVNSFGNGCRAEGVGPCEGASAVELFASARDKLLQLRSGERRPEVIDDANAAPDHHRPPATGEPTVQRKPASEVALVAESRTSDFVVLAEKVNVTATTPTPTPPTPAPPISTPTPPVVVVVEVPKPLITVAAWGRWASFAENDTGAINIDDLLKGRHLLATNQYYVLAGNPAATSMEMPGSGVASFTLNSHEGFITDTATNQRMASVASDGSLKVDFGTRRFDTSLNVSVPAVTVNIAAQGSVESTGRFVSDAFVSKSAIQGIIGGTQASEAVYLYQRSVNGYDASGVASWLK